MAYRTIHIVDAQGAVTTVEGQAKVRLLLSGIEMTSDAAGAALTVPSRPDYFQSAYASLLDQPYVTSIDGAAPLDGGIWIHTDSCMSWDRTSDGISLVDMCPACETCDKQLRVKGRFEIIKAMLNELKDVNLYKDSVVDARLDYMARSRIPDSVACTYTQKPLERKTQLSYQLLKNYLTVVHMWNYAVNLVNSQDRITVAPEDATGLCIQTKHAISSCSGNAVLTCVIDVQDAASAVQPDLSVLAIEPSTTFKPFDAPAATVAPIINNVVADTQNPLHKTATVKFAEISAAGTYEVTFKLLPFIYAILYYGSEENPVPLNFDAVDWNVLATGDPQDQSDILLNLGYCQVRPPEQLTAPTVKQYLDSRTFPSHADTSIGSVAGSSIAKNRWKVTITWTLDIFEVQGDVNPTYTQTTVEEYFFETTLVQRPVMGLLQEAGVAAIEASPEQ